MKLILHTFQLLEVKAFQVQEILLFYVGNLFKAPLSDSAARNDLPFMANVLKFRQVLMPRIAFSAMHIYYHHLWYLVPQTVVLIRAC